jgi:hypothetical protein
MIADHGLFELPASSTAPLEQTRGRQSVYPG